jgi:hypothetical protein
VVVTVLLSKSVVENESRNSDCPNDDSVTMSMAIADYEDGNHQSFAYCYCTRNIVDRINE